ncbi:MAG: hypothetical protein ACR2PG_07675 [Hyphomicrobiaceae bacterium]
MKRIALLIAGIALAGVSFQPNVVSAGGYSKRSSESGIHRRYRTAGKYRGRARVRRHRRMRGGYSYAARDVYNTYGASRAARGPYSYRQTRSGPFDHGFFFDSGMGLNGGNSPYLH